MNKQKQLGRFFGANRSSSGAKSGCFVGCFRHLICDRVEKFNVCSGAATCLPSSVPAHTCIGIWVRRPSAVRLGTDRWKGVALGRRTHSARTSCLFVRPQAKLRCVPFRVPPVNLWHPIPCKTFPPISLLFSAKTNIPNNRLLVTADPPWRAPKNLCHSSTLSVAQNCSCCCIIVW
jgi:hypothetical protein